MSVQAHTCGEQSRADSLPNHVDFEEQIKVARLGSRHFLLLGYLSNRKIGSHNFENDPKNVTLKPFHVRECGSVSYMSNHRAHKYVFFIITQLHWGWFSLPSQARIACGCPYP